MPNTNKRSERGGGTGWGRDRWDVHRSGLGAAGWERWVRQGGVYAGRAEESLNESFQGEALTIAFNRGYLFVGLNSLHSEKFLFGFSSPSRPSVILPAAEV